MTLTDADRMAILDEIIALTERKKRTEYQFTRREFAERKDVTVSEAAGALELGVMRGKLKKEQLHIGGRKCWVYWRPEDEEEAGVF